MDPVIRMFTSDSGTVRWVTTMAGFDRLQFAVSGPDDWRRASFFTDPNALIRFQAEYERFLRDNGFSLSLVTERRWRAIPRPDGTDRRRPA